jgi:RNA polymerase sigma factor (sigma-70 family)
MNEENELLRRYVEENSESAFTELLRKRIDLVYSAALRQVNGDSQLAEEAAQAVFLDLACKASSLVHHPSLIGWLFTATRFIAINLCRTEQRRRAREQKADVMIEQDPDSIWQELCPILDEAMLDLNEKDREAVLLRFFDRQSLSQICQRWGTTENTARMRVERSLEKLRLALQKKGIATSALAVGALLTAKSVEAAPSELPYQIVARLPGAKSSSITDSSVHSPFWRQSKWPAVLSISFVTMLTFTLWLSPGRRQSTAQISRSINQSQALISKAQSPGPLRAAENESMSSALTPTPNGTHRNDGPVIEITAIAADSGKPIPNTIFELRTVVGEKWAHRNLSATRDGVVRIYYPENIAQFELVSRTDGFADTRLAWRPDRGDKIPTYYTLRLIRPIQIGGTVVDADGAFVAGAKVSFGHNEDPDLSKSAESHAYAWIETESDYAGHWQLNRIASEMLPVSSGAARHPEHAGSPYIQLKEHPESIQSLTNGTYIFHLGARNLAISGFVRDETGLPVGGAKVVFAQLGDSSRREAITGNDGGFILNNVTPGASYLSAQAEGFAPTSTKVEVSERNAPYELRLSRGKSIRFRVVDPEGNPLQKARLSLDSWNLLSGKSLEPSPVTIQFEVALETDREGRAVWTNAPDALLVFSPSAKGYMSGQQIRVRPSEEERIITLEYALTIKGNVSDSSGTALDHYRIGTGWPERTFAADKLVPRWSDIDRFWLAFSRPNFEFTMDEPVIHGSEDRGYFFKFEAEGFIPFVTRLIDPKEREVIMNITLQRSNPRSLHTVDPHGKFVPDASVIFLPEGSFVHGGPNGFESVREGIPQAKTDSNGDVLLQFDPELTRVLIACPAGCINLPISEIPNSGIITLQSWGRVDGQILRNGVPSAGELIVCVRTNNLIGLFKMRSAIPALLFQTQQTRSDQEGHFILSDVPPGDSFVIVVRQNRRPNGSVEAVHESKTAVAIADDTPVDLTIDLPEK